MRIQFSTDNAAFGDDVASGVSDCLNRVISAVQGGRTEGKVMDANGNSVGTWSLDGGTTASRRRTARARTAAGEWSQGQGVNADIWSYIDDDNDTYLAAVEDMHDGRFEWSVFLLRSPRVEAASGFAPSLESAQTAAKASCDVLNGGTTASLRRASRPQGFGSAARLITEGR